MSRALRCVALSYALGLAEAKALKWGADGTAWVPAPQTATFGIMSRLGRIDPTPTPAPYPQGEPRKVEARGSTDNTCGYMEGILTSSLYCDTTASCVYNESNMHIGCCDDGETRCPIPTTCYDSTDSAKYTTANGLTLWCGSSKYPHCFTHTYADENLKGYTVLGCAIAGGTGKVWYNPPETRSGSASSTSSISDATSASSSTTRASTATNSPNGGSAGSSDGDSDGDSNGSSSSSTPIGPIVGGVVGGVGAIALIILGIWLLMRQKKGKQAAAAAAATQQQYQSHPPPAPGPGGHQDPHMSQYYGSAASTGFSPMDPRASIAKPPVYAGAMPHSPYGPGPDHAAVSSMTSSPPHSPSPVYQQHGTPSPPPPQQPGQFGQPQHQAYGNVSPGTAYQQHGQPGYGAGGNGNGYQQEQQQRYTAELPATRGDGELRELQG